MVVAADVRVEPAAVLPRPATAGDARSRGTEAYVDGLRAVAVLAVMSLHGWELSGSRPVLIFGHNIGFLLARGGWGVMLFFLLSGFLLARPWFEREIRGGPQPSVRGYFSRRLRRIVPAYYVSIAVLLLLFAPGGYIRGETLHGSLGAWNIGSHLLFVHHLIPLTTIDFNGMNGVYWTLTIEMLFYLTLPLVIPLFLGRWRAVVTTAVAFVLSGLWVYLSLTSFGGLVHVMTRSVTGHRGAVMGVSATDAFMRSQLVVSFPGWPFTFALGILLARFVVRYRAGLIRPVWTHPAVGVIATVGSVVGLVQFARTYRSVRAIGDHEPLAPYLLDRLLTSVLLAALIFGVTVGPRAVRRPLEVLPMRYLGQVSYGVYLYHLMIMLALARYTSLTATDPTRLFWVVMAVSLAITVVVASASWFFIEKPLLRRQPSKSSATTWRRYRWGIATAAALCGIGLSIGVVHPVGAEASPPVSGILGTMRNVGSVPTLTGPATPQSALALGAIYPQEKSMLDNCGAQQGATEGVSTYTWGATGSVFGCRSANAAVVLLHAVPRWERAMGFLPSGDTGLAVPVYERNAPDDLPSYPFHYHIRYRSGPDVVGIVISARTAAAGDSAVRKVVAAVTAVHPRS